MSDLPTDGAFLDGFTFFKKMKKKRNEKGAFCFEFYP